MRDKQKIRQYNKKYRQTHVKEMNKIQYEYYLRNRERISAYGKQRYYFVKKAVIEFFGGKCVCCGETQIPFLTISHKNNDAQEHRKIIGKARSFYSSLFINNFKCDFEIVIECWNCNCSKLTNNGICPHKCNQSL